MKYYTCKKKRSGKPKIIIILILIIIIFNITIIFFDRKVMPSVLEIGKATTKNKIVQLISEVSIEAYDEVFKGEEPLEISTDKDGNINKIQSKTMKLNKLNNTIATKCNMGIEKMGAEGIKVPLGWMTDRSFFYNLGPSITVDVEPIGNVDTKFESTFESEGINQTRYKTFLNVEAKVKIIIPLYTEEVIVKTEVPLGEVITVGKIPETAIDLKK